jgi:DNA invertase Pin-like site-specific DNA recombinase
MGVTMTPARIDLEGLRAEMRRQAEAYGAMREDRVRSSCGRTGGAVNRARSRGHAASARAMRQRGMSGLMVAEALGLSRHHIYRIWGDDEEARHG